MLNLEERWSVGLSGLLAGSRRDDERAAHSSDLGKCLLQTFFRRSGYTKFEGADRRKLLLLKGLHDEDFVLNVLEEGLVAESWFLLRHGELSYEAALVGHLDCEIARAKCKNCEIFMQFDAALEFFTCSACHDAFGTNHADVEYRLIECKTTTWFERWADLGEIGKRGKPIKTRIEPGPYPEPLPSQRLQALDYALNAREKPIPYAIFQFDRGLNGVKQYPDAGEWYDPLEPEWLEKHHKTRDLVLQKTSPGSDPIASGIAFEKEGLTGVPPDEEEFWCKYCEYAQCTKNVSHDNPNFSTIVEEEF
jgi:hypothetical protein